MIFETAIYALDAFRFRVGDATSFRPSPPLLRPRPRPHIGSLS